MIYGEHDNVPDFSGLLSVVFPLKHVPPLIEAIVTYTSHYSVIRLIGKALLSS